MSLTTLPPEVLARVIQHLTGSVHSFINPLLTCRRFYSSSFLWEIALQACAMLNPTPWPPETDYSRLPLRTLQTLGARSCRLEQNLSRTYPAAMSFGRLQFASIFRGIVALIPGTMLVLVATQERMLSCWDLENGKELDGWLERRFFPWQSGCSNPIFYAHGMCNFSYWARNKLFVTLDCFSLDCWSRSMLIHKKSSTLTLPPGTDGYRVASLASSAARIAIILSNGSNWRLLFFNTRDMSCVEVDLLHLLDSDNFIGTVPPLIIFDAQVFAVGDELYLKLRSQRASRYAIVHLPSPVADDIDSILASAIILGSLEQPTDDMFASYISIVKAPVRGDPTHLVLHEALWRSGLSGQQNDPRAWFVSARIRPATELLDQEPTENFGLSRSWISPPLSSEDDNLFDSSSTETRGPVTQKAGQSSFKKKLHSVGERIHSLGRRPSPASASEMGRGEVMSPSGRIFARLLQSGTTGSATLAENYIDLYRLDPLSRSYTRHRLRHSTFNESEVSMNTENTFFDDYMGLVVTLSDQTVHWVSYS